MRPSLTRSSTPSIVPNTIAWLQLGGDIDGEDGDVKSGWSVSLSEDALTVPIGENSYLVNGICGDRIRVYSYNNVQSEWIQVG